MDRTTDHLVGLRLPANHRPITKSGPMQTPYAAKLQDPTVAGADAGHPSMNKVALRAAIPFSIQYPFITLSLPCSNLYGGVAVKVKCRVGLPRFTGSRICG